MNTDRGLNIVYKIKLLYITAVKIFGCYHCRTEGKLFEWCDGPLVQAMQGGAFFLADEISLADDSVLERLNSLLGNFYIPFSWDPSKRTLF